VCSSNLVTNPTEQRIGIATSMSVEGLLKQTEINYPGIQIKIPGAAKRGQVTLRAER
jgi:hypothetical protein